MKRKWKSYGMFAALIFASVGGNVAAEPYTGWKNDYEGTEEGTILLWKFDEGDPTIDSSGNKYQVSRIVMPAAEEPEGKFGAAVRLAGPSNPDKNENYVQGVSSSADALPTEGFSIELWFKADGYSTNDHSAGGYIFDKMYSDKEGVALSYSRQEKTLSARTGNGTEILRVVSQPVEFSENQWTHLALTWDSQSGVFRIYQDGNVVGESVNPDFGSIAPGRRVFRLGNRNGSLYSSMSGVYDNFRVSSVVYTYAP